MCGSPFEGVTCVTSHVHIVHTWHEFKTQKPKAHCCGLTCSGFGHAASHFSTFNSAVVACKKRSDWQVHLGMRTLHRKKLFSWFEVIRKSPSYWNSMWSLGLCRGHYVSYLRCAKKQFCQMWFFAILSWVAAAKVADGGRKTKTDFVWNPVYNAI